MAILFDDARVGTPVRGRSTNGLWISIGVHVMVAIAAITLPALRSSAKPPAPRSRPMKVFLPVELAKLPPIPVVRPRLPDPPAPPKPTPELAKVEAPKPAPPEPLIAKRVEPPPPPPAPPPAFEPPIEKAVMQRPPETGLFERTAAVRTSQAETAVATGAFGTAAAAQRGAAMGAVSTGGFGSGAPAARQAASGQVQTAGFDRANAVQPAVAAAAKQPIDRPVEITFKPTPEYTDDARSARIEGTVSLELEFSAAGEVRVLRVVRGLGHGLDEAAQRAAVRMRFKPAQSDGRPVDSRATVHITFRLS
jgi:TonB family protein